MSIRSTSNQTSSNKKHLNNNLYESLSAYGIGLHRHNPEISQVLNYYANRKLQFTFNPHLIPTYRGILSSIYVQLKSKIKISYFWLRIAFHGGHKRR